MSFVCLLLACLSSAAAAPEMLHIQPGKDATQVEVRVTLPETVQTSIPAGPLTQEQGEQWLRFSLLRAGQAGPPMFGSYERRETQLLFRPRLALERGQQYRATFTPPQGQTLQADYTVPALISAATAEVVRVYPRGDVLPANQLRFYIHFSQPMRGGETIFEQIQLLDAEGQPVHDPWLHDELWLDNDRTLLLYIHPGRIKWGVLLRQILGPVLRPGREYTLVIRTALLDAEGRRLKKEYRKTFRTTDEHRQRVELSAWKLQPPMAQTRSPVRLTFPQPLDHSSWQRFLHVVDARGQVIAGTITVGKDECSWSFQPKEHWQAAPYRIVVDDRLEDTAGNTPRRPFDRDLRAVEAPAQVLELNFQPRRPG